MITGEIRNKVDQNLEHLLVGRDLEPPDRDRADHLSAVHQAARRDSHHGAAGQSLGQALEDPIFNPEQQPLRWSRFKDLEANQMFELFRDEVFPFIKDLNGWAGKRL